MKTTRNRSVFSSGEDPPEPVFPQSREEDTSKRDTEHPSPLAAVFQITRCIYCDSKEIIKRGKRKKKHEEVQLYQCKDCNKSFTGQNLKGKKYPARMVLDGVSYYNVGFPYARSARFLKGSYGITVDERTLAGWVKELEDLCRYSRMREYGLKMYSPHQIIESSKMFHRQVYHFRYHRAKMRLVLEEYKHRRFSALKELLDCVTTDCPHQLFQKAKRASEVKHVFDLDQVRISEKRNFAVRLAEMVLQAVTDNKLRHDALQKFMLANDSVTVATELPVYFDKDDLSHLQKELNYKIPIEIDDYLTGHIDIIQVRNGSVHILDYKPNARKQNAVAQLTLYALMLSAPFHKYGDIRPPMHPGLLCCSSVKEHKAIRPPRALQAGRLNALNTSPYL